MFLNRNKDVGISLNDFTISFPISLLYHNCISNLESHFFILEKITFSEVNSQTSDWSAEGATLKNTEIHVRLRVTSLGVLLDELEAYPSSSLSLLFFVKEDYFLL